MLKKAAVNLFLFFALVSFCMAKPVTEEDFGKEESPKKVLIATEKTEFKDAVVEQIVNALKEEICHMKVVDIKNLGKYSAKDFKAVIIINTCKVWSLNGTVKKYLKNNDKKDNILLLTTAGDAKWKAKGVEVDAITSASKKEDVEKTAQYIIDKAKELLKK